MATITNSATLNKVILMESHYFGRSANATTRLREPESSKLHSHIFFESEKWFIEDFSSNGTWVNGIRISKNDPQEIKENTKVQFGHLGMPYWRIEDLSPPTTMLVPMQGHPHSPISIYEFLEIHGAKNIETTLFKNSNGKWMLKDSASSRPLKNGDTITHNNMTWTFFDPETTDKTLLRTIIEDNQFHFTFNVSQNEEHITLEARICGINYHLGNRSHHELLLLLARIRHQDSKRKPIAEQGWVRTSQACKMLGIDEPHINIHIYRARKQFQQCGDASQHRDIFERRTGEIRFAFQHFSINKAGFIECKTLLPEKNVANSKY